MARTPAGEQHLQRALQLMRTTKSADELRVAQAVALPLLLGLSLQETAAAIGRSRVVACRMRSAYCKAAEGKAVDGRQALARGKPAARNRARLDLRAEADMLEQVLGEAAGAGVVVIARLWPEFERRLGKPVALSTIYRMLARHGWRRRTSNAALVRERPVDARGSTVEGAHWYRLHAMPPGRERGD